MRILIGLVGSVSFVIVGIIIAFMFPPNYSLYTIIWPIGGGIGFFIGWWFIAKNMWIKKDTNIE